MGIAFDTYEVSQVAQADTLHTSTESRAVIGVGESAIITQASVVNTSAATEQISVFLPNPDAAAADANSAVELQSVLPNETVILSALLGRTMKAGTTLRTTTLTGSSVNLSISITVKTP